MNGERTSVFVLHNEVTPYRLPVFEALTRSFDVDVFFTRASAPERNWAPSLSTYSFGSVVGAPFVLFGVLWNYTLPARLFGGDHDVYVVASVDVSTAFSVLLTLLAATLRRKPLVFWCEFVETEYHAEQYPLRKRAGDLYRRLLARAADRCIAFSGMTEEYLLRLGVPPRKIVRTAQVMPSELLPDPPDPPESSGPLRVLSLGYLKPGKGVGRLVRAFQRLDRDDAELVVAGDGPCRESLEALARNDEDIRFVGYVEGERKARQYAAADVFVLPTDHDSWGLVVNEAMYYGTPVVVTENAGSKELVAGNGRVVEAGSEDALAAALADLLADDERRAAMGERSRERIADYDTDHMVAAFREAIGDVA